MGYAKLLKAALRYGGPQLGDALRRHQAQALDRPLSHERARQAHGADKAGGLRRYHHLAPVLSLLSPEPAGPTTEARDQSGATRVQKDSGNIFADFTWEVLTLVSAMQLSFVLLEQPEDLGAMAYGPHAGERPASMWQWPAFADITAPDWKTVAFHQGNFGGRISQAYTLAKDSHPFAMRAPERVLFRAVTHG